MAEYRDPEKAPPFATTAPVRGEQTLTYASKSKTGSSHGFTFWAFLMAYTVCCIALAVILALVINGFNAADRSTPRYINGKLQLRVSDITTLISAGLVVIKLLVTSWTAGAVWRCAVELTHSTRVSLSPKQLSFMTRYKLPPWTRYPFELPKGSRSLVVTAILILVLPQQFIAPLLSGAVNWSPSLIPGGAPVLVNSTDPLAAAAYYYQYVAPVTYIDKRTQVYKMATGLASLPWSDGSTTSKNGTSLTGNGCRHVVNDDGLPPNSTLRSAIVPCIKFHGIAWATSNDQIPFNHTNTVFQKTMSLINDSISHYNNPGHAVLFDPDLPWNNSQGSGLPPSTLFSGTKVLALNIANTYNCSQIGINNFGDINGDRRTFPQHIVGWALGTCYIFANVTFTAGVTNSPLSTYLSSRVVEDRTPINEVKFEPSIWTEQALWLLPDLMTMISLANSSQIPTWHNVDLYAENLIRQSYLAAWDSLHQTFDEGGVISEATQVEPRIQASVSYPRVFSWLTVSLLTSVGGVLLMLLPSREGDIEEPADEAAERRREQMEDTKKLLDDLANLDFF